MIRYFRRSADRQCSHLGPVALFCTVDHPADCILPILVRKLAVGVFPATTIPNRLFVELSFFRVCF